MAVRSWSDAGKVMGLLRCGSGSIRDVELNENSTDRPKLLLMYTNAPILYTPIASAFFYVKMAIVVLSYRIIFFGLNKEPYLTFFKLILAST